MKTEGRSTRTGKGLRSFCNEIRWPGVVAAGWKFGKFVENVLKLVVSPLLRFVSHPPFQGFHYRSGTSFREQ